MLSRNNKILIGCLALLLVMSVGYALFSDNITINGTATAKGSFDITAACQTGISSKLGTVESLGLVAEGGYENDSCVVNDDEVTINVNLLYPGAKRYFTFKATNTGTIDATLIIANIKMNGEMCISDNIDGVNQNCWSSGFGGSEQQLSSMFLDKGYMFEKEDGTLLNLFQAVDAGFINSDASVVTLKPGQSMYFIMLSHLSESLNFSSGEFFAIHNIAIEFPFQQITSN